MNQSPQELLSHLTGLLETTQQQSAQTRAGNEALTQALTAAVQELTQAVRALTVAVTAVPQVLIESSLRSRQQDLADPPPVWTPAQLGNIGR